MDLHKHPGGHEAALEMSRAEEAIGSNLLVVDDEREILNSIRRQLRRRYGVYTATGAEEALDILNSVPIQVVVSDQRMPGMTGTELLSRIRLDYPDTVGMLLTGYSDIQAAIEAINEAHILYFMTKPWDPDRLTERIEDAFSHCRWIAENRRIAQRLTDANALLEEQVHQRTAELMLTSDRMDEVETRWMRDVERLKSEMVSRRAAEGALRDQERQYRDLLDLAQEGIWAIDAEGKTTFVNPKMAEILGTTPEAMAGKPLFDFMAENWRARCADYMARRRHGIHEDHDFQFLHRSGRPITVRLATNPITDASGAFAGALAVVTDVTEQRATEAALREAVAEREETIRKIHHQVRNTFTMARSLLAMQADISTPAARRALQRFGDRFDAIALAHQVTGSGEGEGQVDLDDYLRRLVGRLAEVAGEARAALHLTADPVVVGLKRAVPVGLIVSELLINALEHGVGNPTTGCSGKVRIRLARPQATVCEISVTDDGRGMPEDARRGVETGLGLRLVRMLARRLNGSLTPVDAPGTGFRLRFPLSVVPDSGLAIAGR